MKQSRKVFLLVSLIIMSINVAYIVMNYRFAQKAFQNNLTRQSESLRSDFNVLLDQTYNNLLSHALYISNDTRVQHLFLQGKQAVDEEGGGAGGIKAAQIRAQLLKLVRPSWNEVQTNFHARQLHFHFGPGSTSFLRVHRPEKFGDNMDDVRFTIVDTNKDMKPHTGFETGRVYSGLRGVVPVSAYDAMSKKSVHVGAIEVGSAFDSIIELLKDRSTHNIAILLTKEHIDASMWPHAIEKQFTKVRRYPYVVEATSSPEIESILESECVQDINLQNVGENMLEIDDSTFMVSYFPLRDYRGTLDKDRDSVGSIIFWRNIDSQLNTLNRTQRYNIVYSIFGFIIIELLFYCFFKRVTRRLKGTIIERTDELTTIKNRLNKAQEISLVGNWELDMASRQMWWSAQMNEIYDEAPEKTKYYKQFLSYIHPNEASWISNAIQETLKSHQPYELTHRIITAKGKEKYVHERGIVEIGTDGCVQKLYGTVQDISLQKKLEMRFTNILQATNSGTWEWDVKKGKMELNESWKKFLDRERVGQAPFIGEGWVSLIHPDDYEDVKLKAIQLIKGKQTSLSLDLRVLNPEDQWIWLHIDGQVMERDLYGNAMYIAGIAIDISERKEYELKIEHMAIVDGLTGLFNRSYFNRKLDEMISLYKRTEQPFGLMLMDLDGFKSVNDQYGHPVGDKLLQYVATLIKNISRENDVIVRLGGDEFVCILPTTIDESGCVGYAQKILYQLSQPIHIDGHEINVGMSIGYYLHTDIRMDAEHAVSCADKALYLAKQSGKNTYAALPPHP